MARTRIIPVTLVAALAMVAAVPVVAQDAPPAPRVKPAELRVSFGAGRMVAIDCGDTALQACIEAATPLIDKVAATPAVEGGKPGWHGKGWKGKGHKGKDGRGDKPEAAAPGAEPPPPAPEEGAAPAP